MKKNYFGLFLLLSITLAMVWYSLGVQWYKKAVPFFDSLSYQNFSVEIIQTEKNSGYIESIKYAITNSLNAPLHQIFIAIISPFLTVNRYVLYLYTIPINLFSILIASFVIYQKTGSFIFALLGWGIYLTTIPFKNLLGGVLDQRLDLVTGSFTLVFLSAYLWWEDIPTINKSMILGVVFGLSILNRPIFLMQGTLFIILIFLHNLLHNKSFQAKAYLKQLGVSLFVATVICFPIITPKIQQYIYYYLLVNVDIFSTSALTESLRYNLTTYVASVGNWAIGIIFVLLLTAFVTKTIQWKKLSPVFIGIFSGLLPLVVTRSVGNPYVVYSSLSAITLTPIAISATKSRRSGKYPWILILIFVFVVIGHNLTSLTKSVYFFNPQNRNNAVEALRELNVFLHGEENYISGFTPITAGIVSLAQVELHYPFTLGYTPFHPVNFGLTKDEKNNSLNQSKAIDDTLIKIYKTEGILMLVDLSNYNNNFGTYADTIMRQINTRAFDSGKLIDTGITLIYDNTVYRFYKISN